MFMFLFSVVKQLKTSVEKEQISEEVWDDDGVKILQVQTDKECYSITEEDDEKPGTMYEINKSQEKCLYSSTLLLYHSFL